MSTRNFTNFGRTVRFRPKELVEVRDRHHLLEILDNGKNRKIRAIGSLHSWSEVAAGTDVILDLRRLDKMALVLGESGAAEVEVAAGCTIDAVLNYLASRGYTLPTHGIIGAQTLVGAIATATHGSGRSSFSHYVTAMTVAAYDARTGQARTYEWTSERDLRAARCALGCGGVILSVRLPVDREYPIEERTQWFDRLEQVLEHEARFPRQQFYLVPWAWRWFAQQRRLVSRPLTLWQRSTAPVERMLRRIGIDVLFNGTATLSALLGWSRAVRLLHRHVFPLVTRLSTRTVDRSSRVVMMRHDFYRHIEMELFIPAPHLAHAAAFLEWVLRRCGGEASGMPSALAGDDLGADVASAVDALIGTYVVDHMVTFRRVLPDDTLISMTGGNARHAWYAISLITYRRKRRAFLRMAAVVAAAMASAYGARPHWGKIFPLGADRVAELYPRLPCFRDHCARVDPNRVFVNEFAQNTLGL